MFEFITSLKLSKDTLLRVLFQRFLGTESCQENLGLVWFDLTFSEVKPGTFSGRGWGGERQHTSLIVPSIRDWLRMTGPSGILFLHGGSNGSYLLSSHFALIDEYRQWWRSMWPTPTLTVFPKSSHTPSQTEQRQPNNLRYMLLCNHKTHNKWWRAIRKCVFSRSNALIHDLNSIFRKDWRQTSFFFPQLNLCTYYLKKKKRKKKTQRKQYETLFYFPMRDDDDPNWRRCYLHKLTPGWKNLPRYLFKVDL